MKHQDFKTPKGTLLPIMDIRGKPYLQVAHRLIWFREEHPTWSIRTKLIEHSETHTVAFCEVLDDQGRVLSTAHKMETVKGFMDHTEKAETSAVGRALAMLGYGTQFALEELNEGERLADAPVERIASQDNNIPDGPPLEAYTEDQGDISPSLWDTVQHSKGMTAREVAGEFVIDFGKKYPGKRIKDIQPNELDNYIYYLEGLAKKEGKKPGTKLQSLRESFETYYQGSHKK